MKRRTLIWASACTLAVPGIASSASKADSQAEARKAAQEALSAVYKAQPSARKAVESAAGYAANTLTQADTSVLTVEYKMNLVAPADGQRLVARGEVVRPGRTLIVTRADVYAIRDEQWTLCAIMQQTIMAMQGKSERAG